MSAAEITEWVIFLALAIVALGGSALMLLTMSMYRAGLFLMVSFLALAGLFFLLEADLLAVIQIMMNAGAMLVMIVFMVMLMMDPGGEMMWDMKRQMRLPGPGAFSMSMPRKPLAPPDAARTEGAETAAAPGLSPAARHQMMVDMAMSTEQLPWALAIGLLSAVGLTVLVLATPWTVAPEGPVGEATAAVGELLLSRYMMVFEGAAMLILAGIAGGVILGRRESAASPAAASKGQELQEEIATATHTNQGEATMPESNEAKATRAEKEVWTCPMHREVRADSPGQCPKCGMNLVPESSLGPA